MAAKSEQCVDSSVSFKNTENTTDSTRFSNLGKRFWMGSNSAFINQCLWPVTHCNLPIPMWLLRVMCEFRRLDLFSTEK